MVLYSAVTGVCVCVCVSVEGLDSKLPSKRVCVYVCVCVGCSHFEVHSVGELQQVCARCDTHRMGVFCQTQRRKMLAV